MPGDFSPTGLRVLREVAQSGSFTAAARVLGYTQSAVSRQVAALEAVAGRALFERRRDGVVLTPAGARLLARAVRVLDELDAALRDTAEPDAGAGPVRLGTFATAAAGLIPARWPRCRASSSSPCARRRRPPSRAGCGPGRSISRSSRRRRRSGPPDAEAPALDLTTLAERELVIGVGARHPFARRRAVEVGELAGQVWVASRSEAGESLLGVWPGLAERPDVRYVVRDWWAKLQLVAAGLAITTLAPVALDVLPDGVRAVAVRGEPQELRRAGPRPRAGPARRRAAAVADALVGAAAGLKPRRLSRARGAGADLALERGQALVPRAADRRHPRDGLAERGGGGAVARLAALAARVDEARVGQHGEVLGHRLARHAQGQRELGRRRAAARGDLAHDRPARRVGQRGEDVGLGHASANGPTGASRTLTRVPAGTGDEAQLDARSGLALLPPPEDEALAGLGLLDDRLAVAVAEPLLEQLGVGEGLPGLVGIDRESDVTRNHGVA